MDLADVDILLPDSLCLNRNCNHPICFPTLWPKIELSPLSQILLQAPQMVLADTLQGCHYEHVQAT